MCNRYVTAVMMLVIIEIYVLMSILIEMISYFQKQKQQNTIVKKCLM